MKHDDEACAGCAFGQSTFVANDLQKIRYCRRYPPNIPMSGPGGQGIMFVQPNVNDKGWCGEWSPTQTQ